MSSKKPKPPRPAPTRPTAPTKPIALQPEVWPPWLGHTAAALALLLGLWFGYYRQSPPYFFNAYVCNDDARQQLYWMDRFHNPTLFQNDIVADYAAHYVSVGVKGLYWLLTFFCPAILAGKFVAAALFGLLAYWCYRIGEKLRGPPAGLAMAILVATSIPIADRISGGNPRAFMFPLLAAWLCYLLRGSHVKLAIVAIASALLYPMAFVLAAPVWLLDAIQFDRLRPQLDLSRSRWLPTLIGLGLGGIALIGPYLSPDPRFGPLADRARVMSDPAFRAGGRFSEVLGAPTDNMATDIVDAAGAPLGLRGRWDGESWQARNQSWQTVALALIAIAWVTLALLRIVPLPKSFTWLALSSLLTCGLAWLLLFRLFVPSRYLQYSLPLLTLLGICLLLTAPQRWLRGPQIAIAIAIVAASIGLAYLLTIPRPLTPTINNSGTAFWKNIEQAVPPGSVIAGHPKNLDSLGAFSHRKAFMSDELAHPAYTGYYDNVVIPRINKTLDVMCAEQPDEILRFAREQHVDYLIYGTLDLGPRGTLYITPFNDHLRALLTNGRPRCLLNVPRDRVLAAVQSSPPGNEIRLIRISPGANNAFGITHEAPSATSQTP